MINLLTAQIQIEVTPAISASPATVFRFILIHLNQNEPGPRALSCVFPTSTYSEISARGTTCQLPPADQTGGNREAHIRDQDGNVLCFAKLP